MRSALPRRRRALATAALALTGVAVAPLTPAVASSDHRPRQGTGVALEWYDVTAETIAAAPATTQVTNSRTWAISWLAAARALDGGRQSPDYQDAALAGAVHHALTSLVPDRADELDAALEGTLERIPDGPAEDQGLAAGEAEAQAVLADREGDGLDPASVNVEFSVPEPAPGVWQPTPPDHGPPLQAGTRNARPFLLNAADQYRPGPPPAPGSEAALADLAEVREYGAADSTARTEEQTEVAQFWYGSSLTLYTEPLRVALSRAGESGDPLTDRARLVALFHVALVDTAIATSDTKYAYLAWRPVTAIRAQDDPEWTPLHTTPSHPDYPSGHNTYSGAAEGVLTALTGELTEPFDLTSPTAPGVTRTFTSWRQLTTENIDARVYSGIHTRTADEVGVQLGLDVAQHTLRNVRLLFDE
ncbi:vanadium-dependent haloperoxidase [Streptomyces sp. 6N223]|uniref:vanadium-dependent haloperoxidase n=1 Tax=Streptomyces sp. 6N223 TaxID=3457412 RepID=UPI003FD5A354